AQSAEAGHREVHRRQPRSGEVDDDIGGALDGHWPGMTSTDVYRLHLPIPQRILTFGGMVLMTVGGLPLAIAAALCRLEGMSAPFLLLWLAVLGWNWYVVLGIPYEIRFEAPDRISFTALIRSIEMNVQEIRSIKPYGGGFASGPLFILRHDGGKITLLA